MKPNKIEGYKIVDFKSLDSTTWFLVCVQTCTEYNNYWYTPPNWTNA